MKKWYLSKTVWMGAIAVAIAILEAVDKGADLTAAALAGFGALSILLRSFTDKKLTK